VSLEQELRVSFVYASFNQSYNVHREAVKVGVVHSLGASSLKTTCKMHPHCVLFTNTQGLWEQSFRDHVRWLCIDAPAEQHQHAAHAVRVKYAVRVRPSS
jgi:hypothetical protein